jgi:hypothetical protein
VLRREDLREMDLSIPDIFTMALVEDEGSASQPCRFTPGTPLIFALLCAVIFICAYSERMYRFRTFDPYSFPPQFLSLPFQFLLSYNARFTLRSGASVAVIPHSVSMYSFLAWSLGSHCQFRLLDPEQREGVAFTVTLPPFQPSLILWRNR